MKSITEAILSKNKISNEDLLEQMVPQMIKLGTNKFPDFSINGEVLTLIGVTGYTQLSFNTEFLNQNFKKIIFKGKGSFDITFEGKLVENMEIDSSNF